MTTNEIDKKEISAIIEAMQERKAKDIVSLDLRPIGTSICDYFIICNADSTTQVGAICDFVEEEMYDKCGRDTKRKQGRENGFWVILDYGNIVVHIFQTEYREFYRLEDLWADAVKKTYEDEE